MNKNFIDTNNEDSQLKSFKRAVFLPFYFFQSSFIDHKRVTEALLYNLLLQHSFLNL